MMRSITLLLTLALVVVNLGGYLVHGRLDFTKGGIYTLSDATKKIISEIKNPLTIQVFLSEKLPPQVSNEKQTLIDTLTEYGSVAGSKLSIVYTDPAKDTATGNLARGLGIPELSLQVFEQDEQKVLKTYFGLAILNPKKDAPKVDGNPLDKYEKYETIPVIQHFDTLEYDLTAAIRKVSGATMKTIGFLGGHDEHQLKTTGQMADQFAAMFAAQNPRADYGMKAALDKTYTTTTVTITKDQPHISGVDTLIIAGPMRPLADYEISAIQEFVRAGKNAIFLIDQVSAGDTMQATPMSDRFTTLLAPWGVDVEPSLIADSSNGQAVFSQGFVSFALPYPFFPRITDPATDDAITSRLEVVTLPWTSPIRITEQPGVTVKTLLATSAHYRVLTATAASPASADGKTPAQEAKGISLDPQQDFGISRTESPRLPLAVTAQKKGEGRILLVGDSDFATEKMVNSLPGAELFLLNAIDSFTLGDELIAIRSRGATSRPIRDLTEIERTIIEWGNLALAPIIIIAYGLIRRQLRVMRKS